MVVRQKAPAKVNLSLLVGPVGGDGYHPLFTVFVPIALHDDLVFELAVRPPGSGPCPLEVACAGVSPADNLVTRALRALETETGWTFSGSVSVTKGIPTGAGLGGGSSDGACALAVGARIIAEAGGPRLDRASLASLAVRLGADVPFFLQPRPALATGVGERLEPVDLPELPLVIVSPREVLSTADVYRTYDRVAPAEPSDAFLARSEAEAAAWRSLCSDGAARRIGRADLLRRIGAQLSNDLEIASMRLLPVLEIRKAALRRHGVLEALMSGSGPTVFGLCPSFASASRIAAALTAEGTPALAVRSASSPT